VTWVAGLALLVFAAGFLLAQRTSFLLITAVGPEVEAPSRLFFRTAVLFSALLLASPNRWWFFVLLTIALDAVYAWFFHMAPYWLFGWTPDIAMAVGTAALIWRFVPMPLQFGSLREVSRFTMCVGVGAVLPACLVTVARIALYGWTAWFSWYTAYFAYVVAILVFTPAIVLWANSDMQGLRMLIQRQSGEIAVLVLGLLSVSVVAFGVGYQESGLPPGLIYLIVPLLLWIAVRFGPRGIASALAVTTLVVVTGAVRGVGPFVGHSGNFFSLQLFLLLVGVPLLFLAAATQEQADVEGMLRASEARYRAVVRNLPQSAVLLFDAGQRHRFADGMGLDLVGLKPQGLEGRTPWRPFPRISPWASHPAMKRRSLARRSRWIWSTSSTFSTSR
jgi:integral membrane sensor domain MASE1